MSIPFAANKSDGFTAVELLITLFVAALFIASGYQLYATTTADSANIREKSIASNIGYKYLRIAQAKSFFVCGAENLSTTQRDNLRTEYNLPMLNYVTTTRTMLNSGESCGDGLMKIQVDVKYTGIYGSETQSQVVYVSN